MVGLPPMHADLVAELPISVWRLAIDLPGRQGEAMPPLKWSLRMLIYLCAKRTAGKQLICEALTARRLAEETTSTGPNLIQGQRTDCATAYSTATFAAARSTASAIPEVAASMFAEFIA